MIGQWLLGLLALFDSIQSAILADSR